MPPGSPFSHAGETAETLILIGLVLQALEVIVLFLIGLFATGLAASIGLDIGGIVLGLGAIGILWLVLVYVYSYRRTVEMDYSGARTPTLVFAILSLLTIALVPGVLYIVAYAKLDDAEHEAGQADRRLGGPSLVAAPLGRPPSTPPPAPPPTDKFGRSHLACPHCRRINPIQTTTCPGCGSKLQ